MELRNRVGILTGGSRGLGVHIAESLARKGVHLALAARGVDSLDETKARVERFGVKCLAVPTDVNKLEDLQNLYDRTRQDLGPVDLLVNNAGIEHYQPYQEAAFETIESILRTNVLAAEWLTRITLPDMVERGHGHVVNIASVAGKTAVPFNAVYSSSKHALVGFSWSLREEMKPHGVGVSVVCPGFVSGSGMFADWSKGAKPPGLTGTVTPDQVAEKVVEAIEKDKAEVIVAPGVLKIVDVLHAISPGLTTTIARKSGGYRFLEKEAVEAWRD